MRSRGQNDLFQKILLPVFLHGAYSSKDSLSHGHSVHLSYRPYGCYGADGRYGAYGGNGACGCNGPDGCY